MDARRAAVRKKAEAGDPQAMLALANEWLLNTDPESFVWLERAAAAGLPKAFSSLGWTYERGLRGVSIDLASRGLLPTCHGRR